MELMGNESYNVAVFALMAIIALVILKMPKNKKK